jgi:hypothetical protein
MKIDYLEQVNSKLNEFESSSPYDEREIETCMEALATQIAKLMEVKGGKIGSLSDAIGMLPIDKSTIGTLDEILQRLQEALEVADYDSGDEEDKEDTITNLKADFYYTLSAELKKLEPAQ